MFPLLLIELVISSLFEFVLQQVSIELHVFVAAFVESFLIASLCEETCKFFMGLTVTRVKGLDTPYSVMLYTACGALGLVNSLDIL